MRHNTTIYSMMLAASAALVLAGCNSSSGGDDTTTDAETTTLEGAVADGYLVGAKVCLDSNFNEVCDPGESADITDGAGRYRLSVSTTALEAYPLLAEANESTVDLDTDEPIGQRWTFKTMSQLGSFISPLTTMAVREMELNATMTATQAKEKIQNELGLTGDIAGDYIAAGDETAHNAARVIAHNIGQAGEALRQAAGNQGDARLLNMLATRQIREQFGMIKEAAKSGAEYNISVDTDNMHLQLDEMNATISSTLSDSLKEELRFMWEEEKMARDVYLELYDTWGVRIFDKISQSETKHMESIESMMTKYGVGTENLDETRGAFYDTDLATLYTTFIQDGKVSQNDAYEVGVTIERADIADLQEALDSGELPGDIASIYTNLLSASNKHLEAFSSKVE